MDRKLIYNYNYLIERLLEWFGTTALILGAILSSYNLFPGNVIAFSIGGIFWCILGILWKKKSIFVLNASMMLIYFWGIIRGFGWQ